MKILNMIDVRFFFISTTNEKLFLLLTILDNSQMQKFLKAIHIRMCPFRYYKTLNLYWDERAVNTAISSCGEIDALPVTIHNAEVSYLIVFCAFIDAYLLLLSHYASYRL